MKLVNKKTSSRTKVAANKLLQNSKNNNSARTKRQSSPSSSLSSTTEEEESMIMNEEEEEEEEEIQQQTTRQVYINLPKAKSGKKALKYTAVSDIRSLANKLKTRMSNLAKKVTSSVAHSSAAAAAPLSQPISTEAVSTQPTTTCSANLAPLSPATTNSTKLATPPPVTTTCAPPLSPPPFNNEVVVSAPPSPTLSVSKVHSLSIDTLSAKIFTNTSDSPLSPPLESLLESPTELKKPQQMPLPDTPVSLTGDSTLLPPAGHWSNTAAYKPRLNGMKVLNTYLSSLFASQEVQELSIQDGAIHMTFNDSEKELGESVMDQWTEQQKQARTVSTFIEYLVHDPDECHTLYQDQQEQEDQLVASHNVNRERVQQQVNKQNQPNKASRSYSSSSSSSRRPGRPSKNPLPENEKDKTDQLKMKQKQKAIRKRQRSISSSSTQDSSFASSSSTSASSQYTINTTTQATFGRMRKPNQKGQDVISCICNYSQEEFGRMVQCDDCKHWLHMECLDLTPYSLHYSFRCPPCAIIYQDTNKDDNKVTSALTWRYEAKVNSASLAAVAFDGSAAASVYEEEEDMIIEEEEGEKSDSEVESESDSEIEVSSMTEFDVNTIMEEEEEEEEEEDEFKIAEELAKQAMEIDVEDMTTAPPSPTTTHSTYSDFSSEVSTPQVSPLEDFWVTSATTTIFNTELPSAVCSKEDIFPNVNPFIFY